MGDKSTYAELRDAALRWTAKANSIKEQGEEIAGEALALGATSVGCFGTGLVDQYKGKDLGNGIKQHKIGSLPSSALVGGVLEGAAAFGAFGKYSRVGFSLGHGCVGGYVNTLGRLAGQSLLDKSAATSTTSETKVETKQAVNA